MEDEVVEVLPELSVELAAALRRQGCADLAAQVQGLRVVEKCGCGDDFCSSFYVGPRPTGPWGPGHRNVVVEVGSGMVVLDVVDGVIRYLEVLDRPDVAARLRARRSAP